MATRKIPILTIGLVTVLFAIHFFIPDKTMLYFSATNIARGDFWRIVSGHFVHADVQHLMWNSLGFAILGALIEQRSRMTLWAALGVGVAAVSALLLSPFSQLANYCGLSGVLNTLLLVVLWQQWSLTRSWLIAAVACGSIAKVVIEVSLGESLVAQISWPPYAWSHVAGLIGGVILVRFLGRWNYPESM